MPSNANLILQRIADIWLTVNVAGVGTVTAAYSTQPIDVPPANVPFAVIESAVKRGPVSPIAVQGQLYVNTPLNMALCVALWTAEPVLQVNLSNVLLWRDAVLAAFSQHLQLSPAASPGFPDYAGFVIDAYITDWIGPVKVAYGTAEYAALEFAYTVREHQVVTFAG